MAGVEVERVVFHGEVGDEQVDTSIAVDVGHIDAHSCLRCAFHVVSGTGRLGRIPESPVAIVEKQEVRMQIVADVEIGIAIIVYIGSHHPLTSTSPVREPGRFEDIDERTVALVPVENIAFALHGPWTAVCANLADLIAAKLVRLPAPLGIVANVEIKQAVAIHVPVITIRYSIAVKVPECHDLHNLGGGGAIRIQGGQDEVTFPVVSGFIWAKLFYGMSATSLTAIQIANGVLMASAVRTVLTACCYWLVLLAFGAVPLSSLLSLIPAAILMIATSFLPPRLVRRERVAPGTAEGAA